MRKTPQPTRRPTYTPGRVLTVYQGLIGDSVEYHALCMAIHTYQQFKHSLEKVEYRTNVDIDRVMRARETFINKLSQRTVPELTQIIFEVVAADVHYRDLVVLCVQQVIATKQREIEERSDFKALLKVAA